MYVMYVMYVYYDFYASFCITFYPRLIAEL